MQPEARPHRWLLVLVFFSALAVSSTLLPAQFRGEDEAVVLETGEQVVQGLQTGDLSGIARAIGTSYQPPARNLVVVPFIWLVGANEIALRLPNVLVWSATAVVGALIGSAVAGPYIGAISGLLMGVSGLFDLQAMGHGHGVLTFWIMLLLLHLVREPSLQLTDRSKSRRYVIGGLYCAAAFLWFTSAIVVAFSYHTLYAYHAFAARSAERTKRYILLTAPFVLFYFAYYALFIGLPMYLYVTGRAHAPFGQYYENFVRASGGHINTTSLMENLQGLNGYFFPFVSWGLLIAGVFYCAWRNRLVFWVTLAYGLVFSFYLRENTSNHFLAYFSWTLPWAVAALDRVRRSLPGRGSYVLPGLVALVATWTLVVHVWRYSEVSYPASLLRATYSTVVWQNNVDRPMVPIARDLRAILGPNDRFIVLTDGALHIYYFRDPRFVTAPTIQRVSSTGTQVEPCLMFTPLTRNGSPIRAAVSFVGQDFCPDITEKVIRYEGSRMQVTILRASSDAEQYRPEQEINGQ